MAQIQTLNAEKKPNFTFFKKTLFSKIKSNIFFENIELSLRTVGLKSKFPLSHTHDWFLLLSLV